MSNVVLDRKEMDYADMNGIGRVTIERGANGKVRVVVDGFTFDGRESCRTHSVKAMAWGRDVLATAVQANRLIPGGDLVAVRGLDQDELNEELEA